MGWFDRKKVDLVQQTEVKTSNKYYDFSTPFLKIGKGDLTKPYVDVNYSGLNGFIRFGGDNLFPQIINQMYYTSPLNGSIIDFKVNATIGGGVEFTESDNNKEKLNLYTFLKKSKFNKIKKDLGRDLIMHNRIACIILFDDNGNPLSIKRVGPEKVRVNSEKTIGYISNDWFRQTGIEEMPIYEVGKKHKKCLYYYEIDTPGQDYYPIPLYSSCFNWCYLDGESSVLHKSNIQESIFPSLVIKRPKRFTSEEEKRNFQESLVRKKGASEAGHIWVMSADTKDQLPEIQVIQTTGNDKLFIQTDERMDANICRAHQIDPIILGIRVSGKLGSGMEMEHSYSTFEKNYVMPLREELEFIFNDILFIFNLKTTLTINEYRIVEGEIEKVDDDEDENDEKLI